MSARPARTVPKVQTPPVADQIVLANLPLCDEALLSAMLNEVRAHPRADQKHVEATLAPRGEFRDGKSNFLLAFYAPFGYTERGFLVEGQNAECYK